MTPADGTPNNTGNRSDLNFRSLRSWARTTGGIVGMLLIVQFLTGVLLAFYYVPSVDHAHTTVAFIEKVLSSGSWLRSLHHYGSQLLPLVLFLHLIRLALEAAYNNSRTHWVAAVVMLGLVMAAGGTGYSLPWDARAFFSTRVAEGLLGGLPLVGRNARLWMLGGSEISTLTLSRFFALHVLVIPFLILTAIGWRWSVVRGPSPVSIRKRPTDNEQLATDDGLLTSRAWWPNLTRNLIAAGLVFVALAIWAMKFPAPLGPSIAKVTSDYLPRPGGQFLWLYQSLKYVPGGLGSLVGVAFPALGLLVLASLPWLDFGWLRRIAKQPQRLIASVVLALCACLVVVMTTVSRLSDARDPRTSQQLARQVGDEAAFRKEPFEAAVLKPDADKNSRQTSGSTANAGGGPPPAYTNLCANCHGEHGEGARQGTLRFPPLLGVSAKPRRTVDDIVGLLNDPKAYDIEPPMKSFATKLTEQEKREIAEWVVRLR